MSSTAYDARQDRYSSGAIFFHWVIAALVIANIVIGLLHESLLRGTMPLHKSIGLTVLALSVLRVIWRLTHPIPPLPSDTSGWDKALARTTQAIFYVLLFVMPLTGWAMVSAGATPRPLDWFGVFPVPLLPVTGEVGGASHQIHVVLGWLFGALVLLHIAGALRHHLLLRDRTLSRMLPGS